MKANRRAGLTLIELIFAMGIIAFVLLSFLSVFTSSHSLQSASKEKAQAYSIARQIIEDMRALPLDEVYPRYNTADTDDPTDGDSPGTDFATHYAESLVGLEPVEGSTQIIEVLFPEVSGAFSETYSTDATVAELLGMPKDIDGDGFATNTAVNPVTGAQMIPVLVRLRWRHTADNESYLEVASFLTEKQ